MSAGNSYNRIKPWPFLRKEALNNEDLSCILFSVLY